ncbi:2-keto-4-pentenoate hydratase [Alicyclobacillus hesperidum]|uniref:2-keto-4-pentenoate hydratase n=1 Tax=Alicyclobacillus hesperidum TaxID=89784 RepID=A0A1H2SUY6_9BACL|nr:2-keto-4-pentenoate hydratase [Alicyclobacillus hesperidum]GLV12548.1 2-keto-4-pentenoate hydratase [Alicyclobacillus hesperidum]SDW34849.1 2-keto-4-pentenoate hydratase [Alicyclobacillus hesperidum]
MAVFQMEDLAAELFAAERALRTIPPLTERYPDMSMEVAYQIQLLNAHKKQQAGDRVVGHKIGLTSKPMQRMLGVNEPDFGHLFASMRYRSRDIVDFPLIQPKVEPELAFILAEDLPGPDVDADAVLRATRSVVPALEVIDSRIADWKIRLADTIADNASAGCFVLGDEPTPVRDANLTTCGAVLKVNGEVVETGAGAAVMGHPAIAVAWLANKLSSLGTTLRAGDVVLSGAVSAAVPVRSGDHVALSFGRLGRVEFTLAKANLSESSWG